MSDISQHEIQYCIGELQLFHALVKQNSEQWFPGSQKKSSRYIEMHRLQESKHILPQRQHMSTQIVNREVTLMITAG